MIDNLIIYINKEFEDDAEQVLYNPHEDTVLLQGDDYHHKISYLIKGYLKCLDDQGIYGESYGEKPEEIMIDRSHPMFKKFDFIDNYEYEVEDN